VTLDTPPTRSTRDQGDLRDRLARWLAGRLPRGASPQLSAIESPSATGMSSETLLFEAEWSESGTPVRQALVARVAPDPADVPVFPVYDMETQSRVIEIAGQYGVPAPRVRWLETGAEALGAPFFIMDRVVGRVPPDILPYPFDSWLSQATPIEQRMLQDATVRAIASLHAIDLGREEVRFLEFAIPGRTALARHVENQHRYYDWMRGGRRHPLIERAFVWLESHWPEREGDPVISWGDSRIGNVLYEGFDPVALLDWEMAAIGPRELDLAWLVFMHDFFQQIALGAGLPGMPDFLAPDAVRSVYAETSGIEPREFAWYETYAALRHAIIMSRIHARAVHFGEAVWPEDLDEVIPHRATLERMLDGRQR